MKNIVILLSNPLIPFLLLLLFIVKGNILELLGVLSKHFVDVMKEKTLQLQQTYIESLNQQFKANKPDMQIIAGVWFCSIVSFVFMCLRATRVFLCAFALVLLVARNHSCALTHTRSYTRTRAYTFTHAGARAAVHPFLRACLSL